MLHFQELYQQKLAQALAHHFESKLLLLDIIDFSLEVFIYIFSLWFKLSQIMLYCHVYLCTDAEEIWMSPKRTGKFCLLHILLLLQDTSLFIHPVLIYFCTLLFPESIQPIYLLNLR